MSKGEPKAHLDNPVNIPKTQIVFYWCIKKCFVYNFIKFWSSSYPIWDSEVIFTSNPHWIIYSLVLISNKRHRLPYKLFWVFPKVLTSHWVTPWKTFTKNFVFLQFHQILNFFVKWPNSGHRFISFEINNYIESNPHWPVSSWNWSVIIVISYHIN